MPHPEIAKVTEELRRSRFHYGSTYGSYTGWTDVPDIGNTQAYWEAESTSNPIRKDGSRAISSHNIMRLAVASPPTTVRIDLKPGQPGWFVFPSGPAPRFTKRWNYLTVKEFTQNLIQPVALGVESQARINFLAKLSGAKGFAMDLGVATGEFREVVGQVAGLAVNIVKQAKHLASAHRVDEAAVNRLLKQASLRRNRPYKMSRAERLKWFGSETTTLPEDIVDNWLGFQFGIKPLIGDITQATSYLRAALVDGTADLSVTIRSGSEGTNRFRKVMVADAETAGWYDSVGEFEQTDRVMFVARYQIPTSRDIMRETGFENQASVLWNLCAYSWLADYAIGTGAWLDSMTAAIGTKFLEGTVSRVSKLRLLATETTLGAAYRSTHVLVTSPDGPMLIEADHFRRELLTPVGVLPPPLPVMRKSLGLTQLANALSVLKNFVRQT